jgi:hypothetical protein
MNSSKWQINVSKWFFPCLLGITLMLSGCVDSFQVPALFSVKLEPLEIPVVVPEQPLEVEEVESDSPFPILSSSLPAAISRTIESSSVATEEETSTAIPSGPEPEPDSNLVSPPEPAAPEAAAPELAVEVTSVEPDATAISAPSMPEPTIETVLVEPDTEPTIETVLVEPDTHISEIATVEPETISAAEEVYP